MDTVSEYVSARISQLGFYSNIPLYTKIQNESYVLYKSSGITLGEMSIAEGMHPAELYIKQTDKLTGLQEAQKGFMRFAARCRENQNQGRHSDSAQKIIQ